MEARFRWMNDEREELPHTCVAELQYKIGMLPPVMSIVIKSFLQQQNMEHYGTIASGIRELGYTWPGTFGTQTKSEHGQYVTTINIKNIARNDLEIISSWLQHKGYVGAKLRAEIETDYADYEQKRKRDGNYVGI